MLMKRLLLCLLTAGTLLNAGENQTFQDGDVVGFQRSITPMYFLITM